MTKKEATAPVVKEEKAKAKRGRKPKTTSEVVKDPQTGIPVSMDLNEEHLQPVEVPSPAPVPCDQLDLKIAELHCEVDKLKGRIDELLAQVEDKTKAYDNLRTTYNKLLEDYKVERNKSKQVSKALEDAKARAAEYKSSWNAAKAARDQFASDTAKIKKELTDTKKELTDTKLDLDTFVTSWKKARMLAVIFGIAFVASLIVSIIIAFA